MKKLLGGSTILLVIAIIFGMMIVLIAGAEESSASECAVPGPGGTNTTVTGDMTANARIIIGVGKGLGAPQRAWEIAIATALQESGLKNLDHGDRNSHGLFQQQFDQGWGTVAQTMNPTYAATVFYTGVGGNRGLLDIPNYQTLSLTAAAQAVQHSGYPGAYAKWESQAISIVNANADAPAINVQAPPEGGNATAIPASVGAACGGISGMGATGDAAKILAAGQTQLGVPYAWGGGTREGKGRGFAQGANTIGFDCSSFVMYSYWQGAHISMPRTSRQQYTFTRNRQVLGSALDIGSLLPGDLLFWGNGTSNPESIHHVAIYAGGGKMIEAPHTGANVRIATVYAKNFYAATRPLAV
jgi:cell wall-associated NlpC family hydrolase